MYTVQHSLKNVRSTATLVNYPKKIHLDLTEIPKILFYPRHPQAEYFDFLSKKVQKTINVEFLSNHDLIFWVNSQKNECLNSKEEQLVLRHV